MLASGVGLLVPPGSWEDSLGWAMFSINLGGPISAQSNLQFANILKRGDVIKTPYPMLAFLIDRPDHRFPFGGLLKDVPTPLYAIPGNCRNAKRFSGQLDIDWVVLLWPLGAVSYGSSVFPEIAPINIAIGLFGKSR